MRLEPEAIDSLSPFVLTEQQEHLRREIREFAAREIAPHVAAWDETSEFPLDVVKKLGAMGLLGVIFPAEYGGAGMKNSRPLMGRWALPSRHTIRWGQITSFWPVTRRRRENMFRGWRAVSGWQRGQSPNPAPAPMPATRAPRR
jgi:hypothetical protein